MQQIYKKIKQRKIALYNTDLALKKIRRTFVSETRTVDQNEDTVDLSESVALNQSFTAIQAGFISTNFFLLTQTIE